MEALVPMRKLEIVIERLQLDRVLDIVEAAGASGYTVLPAVRTMGRRHGVREDAGLSELERTKLVLVVASPPVIARIIEDITPILVDYPGTLWVSDVQGIIVDSAEEE
jgi:nitrogen regulatory protein PII